MNSYLYKSKSSTLLILFVSIITLSAWGNKAESIVWGEDFAQDPIVRVTTGLPPYSTSCIGEIKDKIYGNSNQLEVIHKGMNNNLKFLDHKYLELQVKLNKGTKYAYFYSAPLKEKILLNDNLHFSGYLFLGEDINPNIAIKICPLVELKSLKTGKTISIPCRIGGYVTIKGLTPQYLKGWYKFTANIKAAMTVDAQRNSYCLKNAAITHWGIFISRTQASSEEQINIGVGNVKISQKYDLRNNYGKNLALKQTYTWSKEPNKFVNGYQGHPMCHDLDDKIQLTNGILAHRAWWDKETVGWEGGVTITIDLQQSHSIGTVMVRTSDGFEGKHVPAIKLFTSDENKKFHLAKNLTNNEVRSNWLQHRQIGHQDGNAHGWVIMDNLHTKGRYVTLKFEASNVYLDEICVFPGKLRADDISIPSDQIYVTTDAVTPFYKFSEASIASEIVLPLNLLQHRNRSYDLYVDVPPQITLLSPKHALEGKVTKNGVEYTRYAVKNAGEIYLKTLLPAGSKTSIHLTGMKSAKNLAGVTQDIAVNVISIPKTKAFKKILTNVGFPSFIQYWSKWPNLVENYKHCGLNLITPVGHIDYPVLWRKDNQNLIKVLLEAKQAGLMIGGHFSPFNNGVINSKQVSNPRKARYIENDKKSEVNCPRVYMNQYLKLPGFTEILGLEYGFKHGFDIMILDSEPQWLGKICACDVCQKEWEKFQIKKGTKTISIKKAYSDNQALLQEFWNEFYVELWNKFKKVADMASLAKRGKKAVIGLYGCAPQRNGEIHYPLGNEGEYYAISKANAVDFANPTFYSIETPDLHRIARSTVEHTSQEVYSWLTAGGRYLPYERTQADFKNRCYEVLLNGVKGIIIWSADGFSPLDYQAFAEVIRTLQPYEDILISGLLINKDNYLVPDRVSVSGVTTKSQVLLLVSCYDRIEKEINVKLKNHAKRATQISPIRQDVRLENSSLTVKFNGKEGDCVKIYLIERANFKNLGSIASLK